MVNTTSILSAGQRLTFLVSIFFFLSFSSRAMGQKSLFTPRDSFGCSIKADILKQQFLLAGNFYKLRKYHLEAPSKTDPDSLMLLAMRDYQHLFAMLPPGRQANYLSDEFYELAIPVVQYFRNAFAADLLMENRQRLHPKPAAVDPKHHETHSTKSEIEQHHHE